MNQFRQEELINIKNLLHRVDIKGNEAVVVALLQQKVENYLKAMPIKEEKKEDPKIDKKK